MLAGWTSPNRERLLRGEVSEGPRCGTGHPLPSVAELGAPHWLAGAGGSHGGSDGNGELAWRCWPSVHDRR